MIERYFSVNPLCVYLCLLYLALVVLQGADDVGDRSRLIDGVKAELAGSGDWLQTVDAGWLSAFQAHVGDMARQLRNNLHMMYREYPDLFVADRSIEAKAGYSAWMTLPFRNPGPSALVELATQLAHRHQLKVNPTYVFGGTPQTWESLYPGEVHLRCNVSVDEAQLRRQLTLLRIGMRDIISQDSRWARLDEHVVAGPAPPPESGTPGAPGPAHPR